MEEKMKENISPQEHAHFLSRIGAYFGVLIKKTLQISDLQRFNIF
ncbi:hypothetical protein [Sphingobacterium chuzhouense]